MQRTLTDITSQNLTLGDPFEVFDETAVFSITGNTLASSEGRCLIDMFYVRNAGSRKSAKSNPQSMAGCDDFLRVAPRLDIPEFGGYARHDARFANKLNCQPLHFDIKYAERTDGSVWAARTIVASMDLELSVETLSQRLLEAATDTKAASSPSSAAAIIQRGNSYELEELSSHTCEGYRLLEFNTLKLPSEAQE
jgi:hypothetical protein